MSLVHVNQALLHSLYNTTGIGDGGSGGPTLLTTITGNDAFVWNSVFVAGSAVAQISATQVIVVSGTSTNAVAEILDIDGNGDTTGNTSFTFHSESVTHISVALLSPTAALVVYHDGGASGAGTAQVLDIDNVTIEGNTPFAFNSNPILTNALAAISATKAIVVYGQSNSPFFSKAQILDIDENGDVTGNDDYISVSGSVPQTIDIAMLDSSTAIYVFENTSSSMFAEVLDITGGDTITGNDKYTITSTGSSDTILVSAINSSRAVVAWREGIVSCEAEVLNIASGTVTGNTSFTVKSGQATPTEVLVINSSNFIVLYELTNVSYAQVLNIAGVTITGNTDFSYDANTAGAEAALLDESTILVNFADNSNGNFATAEVLDIAEES